MSDVSKADLIEEIDAHKNHQQRQITAMEEHLQRDEALGGMFENPKEAVDGLRMIVTGEVDDEHVRHSNVRNGLRDMAVKLGVDDAATLDKKLLNAETRKETTEDILDAMNDHLAAQFEGVSDAERAVIRAKAVIGEFPDMIGETKRGPNPSLHMTSQEREAGKALRKEFAETFEHPLEDEVGDYAARHEAMKELQSCKDALKGVESDTVSQEAAAKMSEDLGFNLGLPDDDLTTERGK